MTDILRLAIAQTAPLPRDVAGNAAHIARMTQNVAADVIVTPELSLTGYDVGDGVHALARPLATGEPLDPAIVSAATLVLGVIEDAPGGPFNSAAVVHDGTVRFRHRKLYLPTYGMFDEARWFGRGSALDTFTTPNGWRIGILICEDFWHPGLIYVLAARAIDVLVVPAAAPGRGVWTGGEHGAFASADIWERMARTTAQLYGIYVALANRVGVEGAITFAGGSVIAGPDGTVLARASDGDEDVILVDAARSALRRAHTPYAHARDDDPALVLRELQRAVAGA
jgi:predicted amidohydrolase